MYLWLASGFAGAPPTTAAVFALVMSVEKPNYVSAKARCWDVWKPVPGLLAGLVRCVYASEG